MFHFTTGPVLMDHHYPHGVDMGYTSNEEQYVDHQSFPSSQHNTPIHEYNSFQLSPPHQLSDPQYGLGMQTSHATHHITPAWPSMLTSRSTYMSPVLPTAHVSRPPLTHSMSHPLPLPPPQPASAPLPLSSSHSPHQSTPRRTLTDADRRRMCQYHQDNPSKKQTEIGEIFGVERSTVSKVLRQKEKYLYQDDGNRSPMKRAKGKFPDIERALTNWARNYQRQGQRLTDEMIREKAQFFAHTVGSSEAAQKVNSSSWLEKFKARNRLVGQKSRDGPLSKESNSVLIQLETSPTTTSEQASPMGLGVTLAGAKSQESLNLDTSSSQPHHQPFHSQSHASLSSVFSDTAPSPFSDDVGGNGSPLFTPDSAPGHSPFIPARTFESAQSSNSQRPRSQTMPHIATESLYSSPPSIEPLTAHHTPNTMARASSQLGLPTPVSSTSQHPPLQKQLASATASPSMAPPPSLSTGSIQSSPTSTANLRTPVSPDNAAPTQDEACKAMEVVMSFFQSQPAGLSLADPQELITIGQLMQKLRLRGVSELPGGLHRISGREFAGDAAVRAAAAATSASSSNPNTTGNP